MFYQMVFVVGFILIVFLNKLFGIWGVLGELRCLPNILFKVFRLIRDAYVSSFYSNTMVGNKLGLDTKMLQYSKIIYHLLQNWLAIINELLLTDNFSSSFYQHVTGSSLQVKDRSRLGYLFITCVRYAEFIFSNTRYIYIDNVLHLQTRKPQVYYLRRQ